MSRPRAAALALCLVAAGAGASAGAGCGNPRAGKPAPTPPPTTPAADAAVPDALPLDRDYARLAERGVALYEAIAEAFRTLGEDCPKATARIAELAATYADVSAANQTVLREGRARELRPALAKLGDRFDAAAKAIVESRTMAVCSRDPAFTKAFDDLVGAPP